MTMSDQTELSPISVSIDNPEDWADISQQLSAELGEPVVLTPEVIGRTVGSAVPMFFAADASGNLDTASRHLRRPGDRPMSAARRKSQRGHTGVRSFSAWSDPRWRMENRLSGSTSRSRPVLRTGVRVRTANSGTSLSVPRSPWLLPPVRIAVHLWVEVNSSATTATPTWATDGRCSPGCGATRALLRSWAGDGTAITRGFVPNVSNDAVPLLSLVALRVPSHVQPEAGFLAERR